MGASMKFTVKAVKSFRGLEGYRATHRDDRKGRTMDTILEQLDVDEAKYEAETVAFSIDGHNYSIADARKVFEGVENKDDWRDPWAAAVPKVLVPVVTKAVEFFHADVPTVVGVQRVTGKVMMQGRGYQAW